MEGRQDGGLGSKGGAQGRGIRGKAGLDFGSALVDASRKKSRQLVLKDRGRA